MRASTLALLSLLVVLLAVSSANAWKLKLHGIKTSNKKEQEAKAKVEEEKRLKEEKEREEQKRLEEEERAKKEAEHQKRLEEEEERKRKENEAKEQEEEEERKRKHEASKKEETKSEKELLNEEKMDPKYKHYYEGSEGNNAHWFRLMFVFQEYKKLQERLVSNQKHKKPETYLESIGGGRGGDNTIEQKLAYNRIKKGLKYY